MNTAPTLSAEVINNIGQVVSEISSDEWENCITHVIKKEDEYPTSVHITPIIIQPGDDSSSDSEDYEST
nr:unnamed protein product [Callosobruchus chinensis]